MRGEFASATTASFTKFATRSCSCSSLKSAIAGTSTGKFRSHHTTAGRRRSIPSRSLRPSVQFVLQKAAKGREAAGQPLDFSAVSATDSAGWRCGEDLGCACPWLERLVMNERRIVRIVIGIVTIVLSACGTFRVTNSPITSRVVAKGVMTGSDYAPRRTIFFKDAVISADWEQMEGGIRTLGITLSHVRLSPEHRSHLDQYRTYNPTDAPQSPHGFSETGVCPRVTINIGRWTNLVDACSVPPSYAFVSAREWGRPSSISATGMFVTGFWLNLPTDMQKFVVSRSNGVFFVALRSAGHTKHYEWDIDVEGPIELNVKDTSRTHAATSPPLK